MAEYVDQQQVALTPDKETSDTSNKKNKKGKEVKDSISKGRTVTGSLPDKIIIDPVLEEKERSAVFAFGRFNPPTTGHEKLIHKVENTAKEHNAEAHIIASHTENTSKNPLSKEKKVSYLKKVASPETKVSSSSSEHPTLLHQLSNLHKAGVKHLTMVAGSDRMEDFHDLLHKYNGKEGNHGFYNFKSIKVVSAGERDPDAEGTEGMSGTKMREHARSGNMKAFKSGLPKALHSHAEEIANQIKSVKEDIDSFFEDFVFETAINKIGIIYDQVVDENNMDEAYGKSRTQGKGYKSPWDKIEKARPGIGKRIDTAVAGIRQATGGEGIIGHLSGTKTVKEDAPVNSAGGGGIRGLGYISNSGDNDSSDPYLNANIANADTRDNIMAGHMQSHVDIHATGLATTNYSKDGATPTTDDDRELDKSSQLSGTVKLAVNGISDQVRASKVTAKEDVDLNNTFMRDVGTNSLTHIYKSMTPGQNVNNAFKAEYGKEAMTRSGGPDANRKFIDIVPRHLQDRKKDTAPFRQQTIVKKVVDENVAIFKVEKPSKKLSKNHVPKSDMTEEINEDLRQWFKDKWVRMDTKGNIKGDCAREPGEGKPKCLPIAKARAMDKDGRAAAVRRKRREDPIADRPGKGGAPINVQTEAVNPAQQAAIAIALIKAGKKKGKNPGPQKEEFEHVEEASPMIKPTDNVFDSAAKAIAHAKEHGGKAVKSTYTDPNNGMKTVKYKVVKEEVEHLEEKNTPTNPALWSRAKALAKRKFDVYPSAYANGWAAKWYKSHGGSWKSISEDATTETDPLAHLEDRLNKATDTSHNGIDKIMRAVARDYDMDVHDLHNMWVKKYKMTPDQYCKESRE